MKTKLYHRTDFWGKMEKTLALLSGVGLTTAGFEKAPYWVFIVLGIVGVVGKAFFIWMEDKDNNGVIDIFENKEQ